MQCCCSDPCTVARAAGICLIELVQHLRLARGRDRCKITLQTAKGRSSLVCLIVDLDPVFTESAHILIRMCFAVCILYAKGHLSRILDLRQNIISCVTGRNINVYMRGGILIADLFQHLLDLILGLLIVVIIQDHHSGFICLIIPSDCHVSRAFRQTAENGSALCSDHHQRDTGTFDALKHLVDRFIGEIIRLVDQHSQAGCRRLLIPVHDLIPHIVFACICSRRDLCAVTRCRCSDGVRTERILHFALAC